jgi:hypothetical protein
MLRQRLLADEAVRELISRRAYEIYEQRGSQPGHEIEHWVEAENEIAAHLIAGQGQNLGISGPNLHSESKETLAGRTSRETGASTPERRKAAG